MKEDDYPGRFWPITWNCALRFDGYRYTETCGKAGNGNSWLYDVAQAFIETHSLSAELGRVFFTPAPHWTRNDDRTGGGACIPDDVHPFVSRTHACRIHQHRISTAMGR
ncbi:MAG: hypothetical protein U0Y68_09960 [Blastocatellia bacterium]